MNKKILYHKLYRILDKKTPLKFDCGLLCGSKCCRGGSNNGMHLYPGEECMYGFQSEFLELKEESLSNTTISFAVCKGECNRKYRPLACRIFPFAPYISSDGKLYIVKDPRAYYQCPLFHSEDIRISGIFKRKIRDIFHLVIKDPEIKEYIIVLSKVLEEYSVFTGSTLP
jgi:hypothetical protein